MRKVPGTHIGHAVSRTILFSVLLFLTLLAPTARAQCYNPVPYQIPQLTISPSYWAPGHSYTVTVTNPQGNFVSEPPNFAQVFVITQASYNQGNAGYTTEDPYVAVTPNNSGAVYISPTQIAFNITVAANAPNEPDAVVFWCFGNGAVMAPGSAEITPCATPVTPTLASVTPVTPAAFFAGASTTVNITGTGFIPDGNANGCYSTSLDVSTATEDIAITSMNVVSSTQITATLAPTATDPLGPATVAVSNYQYNNPSTPLVASTSLAEVLPIPSIQWNNNTISGSHPTTQQAVTGQQIHLTTTTPTASQLAALPVPVSLRLGTPGSWSLESTNIGGYTPTTPSASVTPTDTTQLGLTTYWIYPSTSNNPFQAQFAYCVTGLGIPNACSPNATAKFKVNGVSSPSLTIQNYVLAKVNDLTGCQAGPSGPHLDYGNLSGPDPACGNPTGTAGIAFTRHGTAPGSGNFLFVQLINNDKSDNAYNGSGLTYTCNSSGGVDGQYPYQGAINPTSRNDAPTLPLPFHPNADRSFNATMYLMWQSTATSNTIPVPLGYEPWTFNATATCNSSSCSTADQWTANGAGGPTVPGQFVLTPSASPSIDIPTWLNPASETCTFH